MRHFALAALAAIVVAVVVVLVVAEEEVAEDTPPAGTTATKPSTVTDSVDLPAPAARRRERVKVERAATLYVEAAERGEADSPGLPTSDELSFERTVIAGGRARVELVGGARLFLRRAAGR